MKRLIKFLKKYKLMLIIALSIIITGTLCVVIYSRNIDDRFYINYRNDEFTFKYDESWEISEETQENIVLKNEDNSTFSIYFKHLDDEYKYLELKDFIDGLLYDIENQNKDYKLLARDDKVETKQKYDGYKFLFENNDSQVMITIIKSNELLTFFIYESSNEYFDILLDSAKKIIYSFENFDKKLELSYKLNLDLSSIEWKENKEITNNLKDKINDKIANNNYLVNYSIPSNFRRSDFNSTRGYFNYEKLKDGSVSLSSNVWNVNIYKYLDKNDSASVFNNYKYVKENSNSYINFKESIEELKNDKYKAYIYKNSYTSVGTYGEYDYENIELIYELDSSHIFYIKIAATNNTIPKELIEKIEITGFKNYSSYINREVKDGYINAELKEFTDYSREKIRKINIKLPEKYYEIDKENDIYTKRSYGMNFDEKKELYQFELDYQISYDLESTITNLGSSINSYKNRKNYKALTYVNDIILNEKTFKVYEAGYTDYSGAFLSSYNRDEFYKKIRILVYQFDKKCFTIKVVGNGYDITDIMLKDVTNFNIVEE